MLFIMSCCSADMMDMWERHEKVIEREFGAFSHVPDHYPKFVISLDKMDFSRDGIIHKNAVRFLMEAK